MIQYIQQTLENHDSDASSSDRKSLTDYREDNLGILAKSSEMEKTPAVDSSLEDFKPLSVVDKAKVQTKIHPLKPVSSLFQTGPKMTYKWN